MPTYQISLSALGGADGGGFGAVCDVPLAARFSPARRSTRTVIRPLDITRSLSSCRRRAMSVPPMVCQVNTAAFSACTHFAKEAPTIVCTGSAVAIVKSLPVSNTHLDHALIAFCDAGLSFVVCMRCVSLATSALNLASACSLSACRRARHAAVCASRDATISASRIGRGPHPANANPQKASTTAFIFELPSGCLRPGSVRQSVHGRAA